MTVPHNLPFLPALLVLVSILGAMALFLAGQILLTGVLVHFLPELSRHDIFFAVSVDPYYRRAEEARVILRRFRVAIWIHTIIGLAVVFAGIATQHPLIPVIGILWQIAGATIAFLRARAKVLPHAIAPTSQREAMLGPRSAGPVYWFLQLGPFAILGARAEYLRTNWRRIPERFPVHWGLNGEPNGWSTRSLAGVFGPLLIGFTVCIFIALFSYAIVHWTRQIRSSGPGAAAEVRFRRVQLGLLVAVQYFIAWVFSGVPFLALRSHPAQAPNTGVFLLGTFAFVLALYAVLIHTGQGGANLMKAGASSEILGDDRVTGDLTPDHCWKAGIFYVNANDPALLVEKRFGIGYTLNFGRPAAWLFAVVMLAMAAVPLAIALLSAK
ncbi:MAG: DUF5808 domain-containing protein [Candidatus Acidiferrales bacterium]